MFKLRSSAASPFGRKVKVVAKLTGFADKIEIITTDTMDPNDPLRHDNPLGKIPVLLLEDGSTLYDSRVIVEYLDVLAGGGVVLPVAGKARFDSLKGQALADGVMDAAILQVYEKRFRAPEHHDAAWLAHQAGKVARGLATLEANPPIASATPEIGAISTACLLEWYEFRFSPEWRSAHPKLVDFLAAFHAAVPSFAATSPR